MAGGDSRKRTGEAERECPCALSMRRRGDRLRRTRRGGEISRPSDASTASACEQVSSVDANHTPAAARRQATEGNLSGRDDIANVSEVKKPGMVDEELCRSNVVRSSGDVSWRRQGGPAYIAT